MTDRHTGKSFVRVRIDKTTPAHIYLTVFAGNDGGNCGQLCMRHEESAWLIAALGQHEPLREALRDAAAQLAYCEPRVKTEFAKANIPRALARARAALREK